ncbi:MAG TPA: hypothetical protein VGM68_12650 [Rhizomicrobium sp.]|jgi:hypothetical protein
MTQDKTDTPVMAVDPDHLRLAIEPLFQWLEAGDLEDGEDTMPALDLKDLLNRLARTFQTDDATTFALFKRALALSYFCGENEMSAELFVDGYPGAELCRAAAHLPLRDLPSEDGEEMSHTFDRAEMETALRGAVN